MIKKKRVLCWLLTACLLMGLLPAAVFAAWGHGDTGSADFTKILISKDKKQYYINENVRTVFYSDKGTKKTKPGNGRSKVRWRYLKISDKTDRTAKYGYCVEFGAGFDDTATYKAKDSSKDKTMFQNLPSNTQKLLGAILCYGRNGSKSVPVTGANDADYYFATQVLVWEAQQGLRTLTKSGGTKLATAHGMPAKHMYSFLKGRPAEKCYNWMQKKINEHLKIHSFTAASSSKAPVYTMKYQKASGKWAVTLTDKNKKSNGFISSNSKISVTKKGYQYTFQSKKPINSPLLIKGKNAMVKGSSTNKLLVWNCTTNTANQALIMGSSDLTPMYVKLKTETPAPVPVPVEHKGIISLLKTGEVFDAKDNKVVYEESPLEGVTFDILAAEDIKAADGTIRLKKGEKADTIITDKDGKAKSCELYLGKYNIVEKETLPGYILLDMPAAVELKYEGQDVALVSAETALHNELKKGSVEIQKTDVSTGEALPETGIEILDQGKKPILQTRTDKEGRAFFDKLPAGNYFFREFDAPKGYQIIEDAFPFEIKENGEIVKCEMTNTKLPVERQPQTSQSPQAPNSPQTGDAHNFWPFIILLLSIAVLVIVVIKKRKRY